MRGDEKHEGPYYGWKFAALARKAEARRGTRKERRREARLLAWMLVAWAVYVISFLVWGWK